MLLVLQSMITHSQHTFIRHIKTRCSHIIGWVFFLGSNKILHGIKDNYTPIPFLTHFFNLNENGQIYSNQVQQRKEQLSVRSEFCTSQHKGLHTMTHLRAIAQALFIPCSLHFVTRTSTIIVSLYSLKLSDSLHSCHLSIYLEMP